jgi:RNA polymerase sigma-70 factor (ECF subfamily)
MTKSVSEADDLQRFRPFLRALAENQLHANLRKKIDPSDVVQQTLLQAVAASSQCHGQDDQAKAGWLKAILQNVVNGLARSFHRESRSVDREMGLGSTAKSSGQAMDLAADQTSPSHWLQSDEDRQRIARAIESLTEEQRQAMVMRYWQDQSLAEIGETMGKSPDAVASLLYRAMKLMRNELA